MSSEKLSPRIARLTDELQEEFYSSLERKEKEIHDALYEEYRQKITNQIDTDREEIDDFNIIISSFEESDAIDYSYVRTEPLSYEKENNLDVLIASPSKQVVVFVECERRLTARLNGKLMDYDDKVQVIDEDLAEDWDIKEYLKQTVGSVPKEKEFVMASRHAPELNLKNAAEDLDMNIILWNLAAHGSKCMIYRSVFKKQKKEPFKGHSDRELDDYLDNSLEKGVFFDQYIDFTYSSSWYLKLRDMVFAIVNQHHRQGNDNFDYSEWKDLFKYELKNYQDIEQKNMYRKFIDYGIDCGVVSLDEDAPDELDRRYRIVSSARRDQSKLRDELIDKMTEYEIQSEYNSEITDYKEQKLTQLEREQATGGKTLSDFF